MSEKLLLHLEEYEGKWVALADSDEDAIVVASGEDAAEVSDQAEKAGYEDVTLMKVLPSDAAYVPLA